MILYSLVPLSDTPPIVSHEPSGWHVSQVVRGRRQLYVCETEAQAKRLALLLSEPTVRPALERKKTK